MDTVNSASVVMTSEEFSMKTHLPKSCVPLESFGGDPGDCSLYELGNLAEELVFVSRLFAFRAGAIFRR